MIPFVQNTRKCKLENAETERRRRIAWEWEWAWGAIRNGRALSEATDSSLVILTGGDGLTVACMCQNVSDRTLYTCAFYCTSIRSQ